MNIYKWSSSLETNNESIDRDHKEIIEKSSELYEAMLEGKGRHIVKELADYIDNYVERHFREEEALVADLNYPKMKEHEDAHQYFLGEFKKLRDQILNNEESSHLTIELNKLITQWFVHHIEVMDMDVAKYLKSKQN